MSPEAQTMTPVTPPKTETQPARISDMLRGNGPLLSVEFFPPKNEEGARQILRTANALRQESPHFVSITYGAGGGTRDRTLAYGELLKEIFGFEVMPHLTCVGHPADEIAGILERFDEVGFSNIMALRGDPPKGETDFKPHPDGFAYASDLIAFIKDRYPQFCLGAGAYPEKHPEAPDSKTDVDNLKRKVDAGADFLTTQLFFDNEDFFRFEEACRKAGIDIPIIPGVLPAVSHTQVTKFCGFCGARLPDELSKRMADCGDDAERAQQVGIEWAWEQITELFERGAPALHLYILNRQKAPLEIIRRLRSEGLLKV